MKHFSFTHISKSILCVALCALMLPLAGCSDEWLEEPEAEFATRDSDAQLVLNIAWPQQPQASRAELKPNALEGKINDLLFIAFGYEGGAQMVRKQLDSEAANIPLSADGFRQVELKGFSKGIYSVYLIANSGSLLQDVLTEQALKEKIRDYSQQGPQAGNLMMVYESGARIDIGATGAEAPLVEAFMKIAAVKVRYSIIFDKSMNSDIFGSAGLRIGKLTVENAAADSYVLSNQADTNRPLRSFETSGKYFTKYVENQANASVSNADVISFPEAGATTAPWASTWVCNGEFYLPERYADANSRPTRLIIDAVATDANGNDTGLKCQYAINLAAHDGNKKETSMPRGNYYEVIGKVKSLGNANIDTQICVKDWEPEYPTVNIAHNSLTLSKATATIKSLQSDRISYTTDSRAFPSFQCITREQGQEVVRCVFNNDKTFTLEVNPAIDVTQLPQGGEPKTAICYLTVGNIRKQITVSYDITPFFIITPLDQKIQWSTGENAMIEKKYSYTTNLGGLLVTASGNKSSVLIASGKNSYTSTVGQSQLALFCPNPSAPEGYMSVKATKDPVTTTEHLFDAYPLKAQSLSDLNAYKKNLSVLVMPPLGDYRIYFRAINDYHIYNGGETGSSSLWLNGASSFSSDFPTEYYGTVSAQSPACANWIDYWAWNGSNYASNQPDGSSHRLYIWTQVGETYSADDNPTVWRFMSDYHGDAMTPDYSNPGWYYYNLPVNKNSVGIGGNASGTKQPEPGTTLMIFHNPANENLGYSAHRVSHHLEAGIPLFDYEDREGWVICDPTIEGLYRVFDSKPYIVDQTYTIYSDVRPSGWVRNYGLAQRNPPSGSSYSSFSLRSNATDSEVKTTTISGKTYYVYTIKLKTVKGYYAKAINILFSGSSSSVTRRVFYYQKFGHSDSWANPRVYFYSGGNNIGWDNAMNMNVLSEDSYGRIYYCDIPAGYENGRVIFRGSGSLQYPASGEGLSLDGKNKIFYSDSKDWKEYGQQPGTSSSAGVKLFGGRAFSGCTGTYNSATGTWTAGAPK